MSNTIKFITCVSLLFSVHPGRRRVRIGVAQLPDEALEELPFEAFTCQASLLGIMKPG
jgi:hypothetical protein